MGCPYCEHVNVPQSTLNSTDAPHPISNPEPDHGNTLLTYLDAAPKGEVTAVQRVIQKRRAALPQQENLFLILLENSRPKTEFRLTKEKTTIGRKGSDILLKDPEVSRCHCVIECYDEVTILRDLGSANGTLLNRQGIREDFLNDQDEIQVGDTHLKFVRRGKSAQAPK